jgi:putative hydroxymethylpyrimidine transport system ATP-binding protein
MEMPPSIRFKGIHRINGKVLFDTDLTLPASQWTCLLGRSGVGKSTILRLMLELETGGKFDGSYTANDKLPLANRISYMAQSDLLLPWLSVAENVCIGSRLRGELPDFDHAADLLGRVGLSGSADKKPNTLSGGMRQRVALARTLFENRPIVFLDEPFSALDAGTRAEMQELAADALQDRTVLLVTHDPAEAVRLGHQIIVVSESETRIWPVPIPAPLREVSDPETLECQTQLLAHLRGFTQ